MHPKTPAHSVVFPQPARWRGEQSWLACALLLASVFAAGCAGTQYRSPEASRADVAEIRERVDATTPDSQSLTLAEANALASPIFQEISDDAAMICRTVSEADSCSVPAFEVVDLDLVNARAGYDLQNEPKITLTRGLIEYLEDQPDELALVIGHEYGHLIAAHVGERQAPGAGGQSIFSSALSALAAASIAVATDGQVMISPAAMGSSYSQAEIDAYLRDTADPEGNFDWFSNGEEIEADYIGTYLAARSGYEPSGAVLIELGALSQRDNLSAIEKEDRRLSFAYWDTHPYSPARAARIQETLEEIELVRSKGYVRPLPPRLILEIQDNNEAFHSLEELVSPLP
jgi:Zn-dependent protease with chaperone function